MGALAARNGGRAGLVALAAVMLLGLGLRVEYAWQGRTPVFDAVAYARIARNLDENRGFTLGSAATQPADNYSPGLPLLVAGIYKASGGVHERLARLILALVGSLSILFTYLVGRRLSSPLGGLIGATAVAIYPALLEYQGMLMSEPLAATLLAASVLAVLWAADQARALVWLLPGTLLGATAMVRPEYLAVTLLISLIVFARGAGRQWRSSLARAALLLLGAAVLIAPWTIRNAIALDRLVPISTGGGQVLFSGTYLPSGGDPQRVGEAVLASDPSLRRALGGAYLPRTQTPTVAALLSRVRLEQILAALAAQRFPGLESDRALSRMGREQLWYDISEQPLQYAGFLATKVGAIWSHGPREVMRRPPWEALHWALVGFGLLGLALLVRRRRFEALLFATVFLAITAISALLVASPRRVLVMIPLVGALAGVGVLAARERLGGRGQRRPGAGIA
jgi:4-amino-4-deoxy-L-arabinose transferase-like glycosyltransferase